MCRPSIELSAVLTYPLLRLICPAAFRYKRAAAVNADFTRIRQVNRRHEGTAMSTRQTTCAIERTAQQAGSAATLILGSLLLLIRP
jgi:hypothetical protein